MLVLFQQSPAPTTDPFNSALIETSLVSNPNVQKSLEWMTDEVFLHLRHADLKGKRDYWALAVKG